MTLILVINTRLGAIEVRRDEVRPRPYFWWNWAAGDVAIGPFDELPEALADLVDAYRLTLAQRDRAGAGRRAALLQ